MYDIFIKCYNVFEALLCSGYFLSLLSSCLFSLLMTQHLIHTYAEHSRAGTFDILINNQYRIQGLVALGETT